MFLRFLLYVLIMGSLNFIFLDKSFWWAIASGVVFGLLMSVVDKIFGWPNISQITEEAKFIAESKDSNRKRQQKA